MRRFFKTAVSLLAGLALTAGFIAATQAPASAATSCQITFSKYSTVKKGTKGKQAKAAECLLKSAGYPTNRNGNFSASEVGQLKKFQKKHKIRTTGVVDKTSWTALLARGSKPTLKAGKRSDSVKRLQRALTASGRAVPATGYFGSQTKSAVKSVQRALGYRQSGIVASGVWGALQSGKAATATAKKAPAKKPAAKKATSSKSSNKGAKALAYAKKQLGDSYRYGGQGPNSWDCSGLTGGAWKAAGVKLPRTSQAQYRVGKKVAKSDLKPGDLVFFYGGISHVAIYAGQGKVIHASQPGKPVAYIAMKYMPYQGARRPA